MKITRYLLAVLWVLLVCGMGYLPQQSDFIIIFLLYVPLFLLYVITYRVSRTHHNILFFVFLSVILRGCLLFAFPNLSDDIYRFVWDGQQIKHGVNPYLFTPEGFLATLPPEKETIFHLLYPNLNSPQYYSVYPPLCQGIFTFATWIFPESVYGASVILKLFVLIAETITIYFLLKLVQLMHIPQQRVLLYALNPLVIIEFSGNIHFEAIMIMFLCMSFWFYMRQRSKMFSISLALAAGIKLLPLMFLPFFLRRFRRPKIIVGFLLFSIVMVIPFLFLSDGQLLSNFRSSLDLYFRKFEFNASIYYLFRWIGFQIKGYNVIGTLGPYLSLITLVCISALAFFERPKKMQDLYKMLLLAFSIYLFLSTTIHPWYLGIPILLTVLTRFRYPVFWSVLIMGTYINYSYEPYHENLWVVFIEYFVLYVIFITEVFKIPLVKIFIQVFFQFLQKIKPSSSVGKN